MFAGGIDLEHWNIRPDVTLLACIGFSGHLDGESMAGVAGGTAAPAVVGVDSANPLVRPPLYDRKLLQEQKASLLVDSGILTYLY